MDGFTLIAEPTRRRILDRLRVGESDVNALVRVLAMPQPVISKHLRVLRDAGAVHVRIDGPRRVYQLGRDPLPDVLAWVTPFHLTWSTSLDRLTDLLDEENPQ